jgi:hypothetical protein
LITVPLDIAGPTGGHKSIQYSSEVTENVYLDKSESGKRGAHSFPGLKAFGTSSGLDRGQHVMAEQLYKLNATTLYRVSSVGAYTSLGTISGTDRAIFADDGTNLFIVANNQLYKYNGTTVSTVSQSVVSNPKSIAYINKQFIITGDNGLWASSDVGDGSTYNALNFAEAETRPDPLVRDYIFNQVAYLAGSETIDPWRNTGSGNPPFSRQDTPLVNLGLLGKHAITNTKKYMYLLSPDKKIYQIIGVSFRPVSTHSISREIELMIDASDCIASTYTYDGQEFVILAFSNGNKTFVYSETYDYWFTLSSGQDYDRWLPNSVFYCYGKWLTSDRLNGNVYELDRDTYTHNSDYAIRTRTLPSITGELIRKPGKRVMVSRLRIDMQVGVGLVTGQGVNPVVMCEWSNDGGHTWGVQSFVEFGEMGNYTKLVTFDQFITGYEIRARIRCSDPVYLSVSGAEVEMREAGY